MQELTQEVTAKGIEFQIPREMLEDLGWNEGQKVTIRALGNRITIVPAAAIEETLERRALAYLNRHVGDATTVGSPVLRAGRWELPVYLSYEDREVGLLVFSADGELLREESSSSESMRQRAGGAG